ncbi:disulfide bond formation protein B [Legionella nagasakiensis]|uniref:disulfide bond formation protein B n=1 Tax=Legionella nagasakiensis TaxID=535290 RepID=UPI0010561636|nr:disulfide bond formation protein B [Legionella nagasakiensis]
MTKRNYRSIQATLLLLTVVVVGSSFYFQYVVGLQPCPLCLMQRLCAFLLGMFCLMGMCLSTLKRGRLVALLQMFFAAGGLFFATRQLWLQSLPAEQTPACLPGLEVLIRYFPWQDVAHALFWGSGDCAEVSWRWLGLSMPAWAALYFFVMFIACAGLYRWLGRTLRQLRTW